MSFALQHWSFSHRCFKRNLDHARTADKTFQKPWQTMVHIYELSFIETSTALSIISICWFFLCFYLYNVYSTWLLYMFALCIKTINPKLKMELNEIQCNVYYNTHDINTNNSISSGFFHIFWFIYLFVCVCLKSDLKHTIYMVLLFQFTSVCQTTTITTRSSIVKNWEICKKIPGFSPLNKAKLSINQ